MPNKEKELLALLAVTGPAPITKRAAYSYLWAECNESRARDNLYKLLNRVKNKILPLINEKNSLRLTSDVFVDLWEFERLFATCPEEALLIYRGLLLFEETYEWASEFEARYEQMYMRILNR